MTNDAIKQAFKDMFEIEANMYETYVEIVDSIKDEKIKKILEKIIKDEKKHESNVSEILKILDE